MILMLSGIGPAEHLKEVGIDIIEDIEVGSVLIDDVATNSILFASDLYLPSQTQEETVKDYLHGSGPLTRTFSSQGVAYYKSKLHNDLGLVDFEIVALTQSKSSLVEKIARWQNETYSATWGNHSEAIRMDIVLLNPRSRGSVRLASNDPFEFPLIDSRLLSDPDDRDIAVMYEALQLAFDILQTPGFRRLNVKYVGRPLPGCKDYEFLSKEYWFCFLRQTCFAPFHAKGSCPMGTDPKKGAVVDSNFRVFGIEKLRVADSSIFPISPGGHPSATCIMLGEKISDVIKSQYL
ncbi:hypothetical protein JTB14_017781 [Gonioctena quinquepunctata]|nr:hypothetical protein JTB14_017781 [Gonioctena quinquepunctata]